ncbi:hypothetical protein [Powai lake megavirus]|uniref:Uncharacterized protein n=1 Tax=Powai lake megavirus TaxID=1842663 RepID=A0A167RP62_9VIRU|nr:hypothetical protein QJ849_gp785 [Powai lake megavirus]ANB50947.1 hypothetical protein [Powai lake megavirus]
MNKYGHHYKSRTNKSEKFIYKKDKIKPIIPKKIVNEISYPNKHRNSLFDSFHLNLFSIYRDLYTNNSKSEALIKFIKSEINCFDIDKYLNTHLMCACKYSYQDSNIEIVKLILNQTTTKFSHTYIFNGIINDINISRCSALEYAMELPGNKKIIKLLVKYGTDVNYISYDKIPLIVWASSNYEPDISIAKIFLNAGANINFYDYHHRSLLHCILKNEYCKNTYEIIKFLLDNGFDIDYETNITKRYNYIDRVIYYREQSIFACAYKKYILDNNIKIISLILDYGYNYTMIRTCDQQILKIIDAIKFKNTYFKSIHREICDVKNEFIYRPGSLRFKLASMNWYINSGYIYNCLTLKNLDVIEYLGVFDEKDLISKIKETIREIYD